LLNGLDGDFSLKYLCKIHKYLFQDVYSWAGKLRTVDVSKGTYFCRAQFIADQFNKLYQELKSENFLRDYASSTRMADRLAYYLGEINMIHPFREGNGRTQRVYIELLCRQNGTFELDFTLISKEEMIRACALSAQGGNSILDELMWRSIVKKRN
jgi:cell filamentation protein